MYDLIANTLIFQINVAPEVVYELEKIDDKEDKQFKEQRDKLRDFLKSISFEFTNDKNLLCNVKFIYEDVLVDTKNKEKTKVALKTLQSILTEYAVDMKKMCVVKPKIYTNVYNKLKKLQDIVKNIQMYY